MSFTDRPVVDGNVIYLNSHVVARLEDNPTWVVERFKEWMNDQLVHADSRPNADDEV